MKKARGWKLEEKSSKQKQNAAIRGVFIEK
jgi:hypothetical protein